MESNCEYCQEKITSPYTFPIRFCPDTNHDQLFLNQDKNTIVCLQCGHSWKPRNQGIPSCCPRCKSYKYSNNEQKKVVIVRNTDVKLVICHRCGGMKKQDNIVCSLCVQPNTNITHFCSMPIKYWKSFNKFLGEYVGDDKVINDLKKRLLSPIEVLAGGDKPLSSLIEDKKGSQGGDLGSDIPSEEAKTALEGIELLSELNNLDWEDIDGDEILDSNSENKEK